MSVQGELVQRAGRGDDAAFEELVAATMIPAASRIAEFP